MKIFLKQPIYFEITVPDGTDRQQVIRIADDRLKPALRALLKEIKMDEEDLIGFPGIPGDTLNVRIVTETEVHRSQLKSKIAPGPSGPSAFESF